MKINVLKGFKYFFFIFILLFNIILFIKWELIWYIIMLKKKIIFVFRFKKIYIVYKMFE